MGMLGGDQVISVAILRGSGINGNFGKEPNALLYFFPPSLSFGVVELMETYRQKRQGSRNRRGRYPSG